MKPKEVNIYDVLVGITSKRDFCGIRLFTLLPLIISHYSYFRELLSTDCDYGFCGFLIQCHFGSLGIGFLSDVV